MNPRRKKRLSLVLVIGLGLSVTVGLLAFSLSQNIDLFYTPGELVQGKGNNKIKPEVGQRLRIGGMVLPGSVERAHDSLQVQFSLVDATGSLVKIYYEGILPDLFREGQGIVANGVLLDATSIEAHEVLAKHDENYMPPEVAESLQGMQHFKPEYSEAQLNSSASSDNI